MSTRIGKKINRLILTVPKGAVLDSLWLHGEGYSTYLIKKYRDSGWLKSVGVGASIRTGDEVSYVGGIYALQAQKGSSIHIGGRSALSILGKAHYLELAQKKVTLFSSYEDAKLPKWFISYDWGVVLEIHSTNFLPKDIGFEATKLGELEVNISGEIRALMECLLLVPKHQELTECYEIMESMNNLRPREVQEMLENCNSIKVKRLFLYLAKKADHAWFQYIDISRINLGSGKREIIKHGVLNKEFLITVPKSWEIYDQGKL